MATLFLCSYLAGVKPQLADFVQKRDLKRVCFVTTAGNVKDYTDYIDEGRELFRTLGVAIDECDIATLTAEDFTRKLEQAQAVYFAGGNTFYLLQELQQKNLLQPLRKRVEDGLLYMGESAGAIIAASDIGYSHLMDERSKAPHLTDDLGLNLVDFYPVPHVGEFPFEESAQAILERYQAHLKLLPLSNSQAVLVDGKQYQVL
ncbi:Type 1 glutamine amidotransferase-like domain-containing protein [Streptococcus dentiloxodontae]